MARNGGMLSSQRAWLGDDRTQRARGEGWLPGEASNSHSATPGDVPAPGAPRLQAGRVQT